MRRASDAGRSERTIAQQTRVTAGRCLTAGHAWGSEAMVATPSRNYSVAQLPDMLLDLGLAQTHALYTALQRRSLLAGQVPPRNHRATTRATAMTSNRPLPAVQLPPPPDTVPTHVMYSTGVDTTIFFRCAARASGYTAVTTRGARGNRCACPGLAALWATTR